MIECISLRSQRGLCNLAGSALLFDNLVSALRHVVESLLRALLFMLRKQRKLLKLFSLTTNNVRFLVKLLLAFTKIVLRVGKLSQQMKNNRICPEQRQRSRQETQRDRSSAAAGGVHGFIRRFFYECFQGVHAASLRLTGTYLMLGWQHA